MHRPIIVKKPDGAGKTKLCQDLCRYMHRTYHHTGGPPIDREALLKKFLVVDGLVTEGQALVIDRHPAISEPIYREAKNEPLLLSEASMLFLLQGVNPVLVYCRRSLVQEMFSSIDQSQKKHKPQVHLEAVMKNYKRVVDLYDRNFDRLSKVFTVLNYDWAINSFDSLKTKLGQACAD